MEPEITFLMLLAPCVAYVAYRIYRTISTRRRAASVELVAGGRYSVRSDGKIKVVKVLVVDSDCIHVRVYKNTFLARPQTVTSETLTLGTIHDADGFGMGHLPVSREAFFAWAPALIDRTHVSEEELEGYAIWKKSNGGVFT